MTMYTTNHCSYVVITLTLLGLLRILPGAFSFHHASGPVGIPRRQQQQQQRNQLCMDRIVTNQCSESDYNEDSLRYSNNVVRQQYQQQVQSSDTMNSESAQKKQFQRPRSFPRSDDEISMIENLHLYFDPTLVSSTMSTSLSSSSSSSCSKEEVEEKECVEMKETASFAKLPPVLQQIADERMEYRMNLGRAMDALRQDMSDILVRKPDFSIYHEDIEAIDPSGIQLKGLKNYKSAIAFFQTFVQFWFDTPTSTSLGNCRVQYRMVYDFTRSTIRISWSMKLVPKFPMMVLNLRPLYVDGISHYTVCARNGGKITEHKIEKLLINNTPVLPPFGIWNIIQQQPEFLAGRVYSPKVPQAGIFATETASSTGSSFASSTTRPSAFRMGLFGL